MLLDPHPHSFLPLLTSISPDTNLPARPRGLMGAHAVQNSSALPLRILDCRCIYERGLGQWEVLARNTGIGSRLLLDFLDKVT